MKKILLIGTFLSSVFAFNNVVYTMKILKPDLNIDRNYIIVNSNIDKKFVISPEKLKKNSFDF